jgi:hypothetical protein
VQKNTIRGLSQYAGNYGHKPFNNRARNSAASACSKRD